MNWRKRKKLNRLAKRHGLTHGYEYKRFIRKKVIKIRYKNRNKRIYSLEFVPTSNICQMKLFATMRKSQPSFLNLKKEGKLLGEIDHPSDRLPGGEYWKYPAQIHIDLAQNPDVTTEARIGISPKGDVKFYGFDICKR